MAKRYKEDEDKKIKNKQNQKKQDNRAPLQSTNKKGKRTKEDNEKTQKELYKQQQEKDKMLAKKEKELMKKQETQIKQKNKEIEKQKDIKERERQKRIKQINKEKSKNKDFDKETEMVIEMTNKKQKNELKPNNTVPKSKKQKKIEKKKKRKTWILKLILFILVLIAIVTFAMVSPIFQIKQIEVVNNEQVSSDEIISLSGLKKNDNIFRFLDVNVENSIKQNPYIESVKIHRNLPSEIKLEVTEKIKKFAVKLTTTYAYISSQGYVLEIAQEAVDVPILIGVKTPEEKIVPNNRLENEDLKKLETTIKIMNVCKDNNIDSKVTSIDITNENEYIMNIDSENKKVYLGDASNLSNKMIYVQSMLNETQAKAGEIFVNGDLNGKFKPYFRESLN